MKQRTISFILSGVRSLCELVELNSEHFTCIGNPENAEYVVSVAVFPLCMVTHSVNIQLIFTDFKSIWGFKEILAWGKMENRTIVTFPFFPLLRTLEKILSR